MPRRSSDSASSEEGNGRRDGGDRRQRDQGDELATKVLNIQSKRFFLDVKQNDRGRFIKIAEVASGGRKTRVFMSMHTANELKNHLSTFIAEFKKLGDSSPGADDRRLLHSESITADKRRYFLDLRENPRGRFLRITQSDMSRGTRQAVAIPAEGLVELKNGLAEHIDEYGEGYMDDPPQVELPPNRDLRVDGKYFYFDPGHNDRGDYLKISEVKPSSGTRNSMTISFKALPQFREILQELEAKVKELRANDADGNVKGEQ